MVDIVEGSIDICHAYNIEVSLDSLLDRTDEHVEYLRFLTSHLFLSSTRTEGGNDDIGLGFPEVEGFGGGKCFNLLRLAQLAALGYLVSVLLVHFHLRSHIQTQERQCALNLSKRVVNYSNAIVSWTLRVR